MREVLEAICEQDFLSCSYGFRPGRGAHDAVRALDGAVHQGRVNWILEADIVSFFDRVDRTTLLEMLRGRIADESLVRLVGKCLHVGVIDGAEYSAPEVGTAQGSVLSPLLGNVYLHHVLDSWFDREVKPRMRGSAQLIRYCDDFVMCFEHEEDARRVMAVLSKRMERYGLTLHPDKTRLLDFRRPPPTKQSGRGPTTFDFLGFTFYWARSTRGRWWMTCKTRRGRLRRFRGVVTDWCRRYRHLPVEAQHAALTRRMTGHMNYFGVSGNFRSLQLVLEEVKRVWYKWLRRRGQHHRLTWERFRALLARFPLPRPRIVVRIWAA